MKKEILKYVLLTTLMFLSALNFNFFLNPTNIVAGGTNGIAIIINYVFNISPSLIILVVSFTLLFLALIFKQYKMLISAIYCSLVYPFFVAITENIVTAIQVDYNNVLMISIFSGIIGGIVSGTVCKLGLSQGGIILISQVLYEKTKISISKTNALVNVIIVIMGGYVFGISNVLYACIYLYVSKIVMDKIIIGTGRKKIFYIMTNEVDRVSEFIKNSLGYNYTIFDAKGGYKNKVKQMIMTSVPTSEYFKLKEGIHKIDKTSFFIITDSYEVNGGK